MALKKVLTLRTVVATSAGITLATSSFVAAAQVAGFLSGDSAWLAILVGGILCLLAAACFSELNSILPSAAGIRLFLGKAFGEKVALTFSLLYMILILVVVGAESFILSQTLTYAIPQVAPVIWITVMLVTVTLLNIRGVKVAGTFQDIVTYGVIVSIVLISLWGLHLVHWHLAAPLATGGASGLIQAIATGIFLFIGFEWVTPLAEEVTENRIIAHGMFITVGIVCVVYALFTAALTANVPRAVFLHLSQVSPITQVLFAQKVLGEAGLVWIVLVCLACSFGTFNAGLLSVPAFLRHCQGARPAAGLQPDQHEVHDPLGGLYRGFCGRVRQLPGYSLYTSIPDGSGNGSRNRVSDLCSFSRRPAGAEKEDGRRPQGIQGTFWLGHSGVYRADLRRFDFCDHRQRSCHRHLDGCRAGSDRAVRGLGGAEDEREVQG